MDASDYGRNGETGRLVTRRDLETMDVDLVALGKALRAERKAPKKARRVKNRVKSRAKSLGTNVIAFRTQERLAA